MAVPCPDTGSGGLGQAGGLGSSGSRSWQQQPPPSHFLVPELLPLHACDLSITAAVDQQARGQSLPWAQPPGLALKAAWARSEPQLSSPQLSPSSVPHHQVLHQRRSIGRL